MRWVWTPKGLILRQGAVDASHVDVVDETGAEEARVNHSVGVNTPKALFFVIPTCRR